MSILIAGVGSIGRRHLRNLRHLGVRDLVLLRSGRSTYGDEEVSDLPVETEVRKALLHHPTAVIVANPTALHLDIAIPAADAGCHLLIEKPVSHTLERVSELLRIVREKSLKVLVGYQFRFHPALRQIKQWLAAQAIGTVTSVHVHWGEYLPGWHPGEDYRQGYSARSDLGGGVVLTLSHPFDYLRWLLGEIHAVSAVTRRLSDLELDVEDVAEITLHFASGMIGTVHLDYVQRPPGHWLQIRGHGGTIYWDAANGKASCYRAPDGQWTHYALPPGFERNTMFLDEMQHFLACLEGEVAAGANLEDGVRALEIAVAAKRSASEGRVVEV